MAITTNIKNYPTAHGKAEGGGGGTTFIMGNINNTDLPDNINVGSVSSENGTINYLQGKSLSYNDGQFLYLSANDGAIQKIQGDTLNYQNGTISNLQSDDISTGKLTAAEAVLDKATIKELLSTNITTDYLTVTKQAHFFELIIDKMRSVGGTIIESAANCEIDYVKAEDANGNEVPLDANNVNHYNVYWVATDRTTGRQITNGWLPFDQAICQSFNNASSGVNYDISNKYYWRLVEEILFLNGQGQYIPTYMNLRTGETSTTESDVNFNEVQISIPSISFIAPDPTDSPDYVPAPQHIDNAFTVTAQSPAVWNNGTLKTYDTTNGLILTPNTTVFDTTNTYNLSTIIPTSMTFNCSAARLNISIYFNDGTSIYVPYKDDPNNAAPTSYTISISADSTINRIEITNADDVKCSLVYGMKLSNTDKDVNVSKGSSIPSEGDNIVQLGYRWNAQGADASNIARASAIIIAAYKTPDTGIYPPSYAQYVRINDYSLSTHRQTYFDATRASFVGDFKVTSGGALGGTSIPLDDYISTYAPTYNLYTAYANDAYGNGFSFDPTGKSYMGMDVTTAATASTTPSDYEPWFLIQGAVGPAGPQGPAGPAGATGAPATQYKLADVGSYAAINSDLQNGQIVETMSLSLAYKAVKIVNSAASYLTYTEAQQFEGTGLYAYCRLLNPASSDTSLQGANYYRMTLSSGSNGEAIYTYSLPSSFNATSQLNINANKSITISLIGYYTSDHFPESQINTQRTFDTQTIQLSLQPNAAFEISQANATAVAQISSLVTGSTVVPSSIPSIGGTGTVIGQMSYVNQKADGIQSTVVSMGETLATKTSVEQTSNMIQQTVSSLNVGTKNYFNFTYCTLGSYTFPFIQGYGIEGYGGQNQTYKYIQVNNLDFQTNPLQSTTEKIKLSVRCEMKMQANNSKVKVDLCDTDPSNIAEDTTTHRREVQVTTAWQPYSFIYEVTNDVAHFNASNVNGHITFSSSSLEDTNRLYVRNLMITKGDIPNDVNISWKDYESQMTRDAALVIKDDEWSHRAINATSDQFKGYTVWGCTSTAGITANTDIIWKNNVELKQGKIYTLSFYAKDTTTIGDLEGARAAYLYDNGGCVNSTLGIVTPTKRIDANYNVGQPSIGNRNDGYTEYMLNRGWQQFIIHWLNANTGNRSIIPMRILQSTSDKFEIAGVELREGWWDVDGLNSTSLIKQTADEIVLKVKDTGIDINDGTITLSADNTVVDGQLILKGAQGAQGLLFRDSSGNDGLKLSTAAMPSLSNFISGYQGYPHLDLGTNGYGFQSSDRYLYVTSDDIVFNSDANYGKNNEGLVQIKVKQSGGQVGEILDYIGDTQQSESHSWHTDPNTTANVSFVESITKIQHNGVRCVRLPSNPSGDYTFIPSSKDKVLLCYPSNGHKIRINVGASGVIGNGSNIGHTYYIKIMPTANSNVKVELYGATIIPGDRDIEDSLSTTLTITDNCIYTVIVLGNCEGGTTQYVLVGKMQSGSYA